MSVEKIKHILMKFFNVISCNRIERYNLCSYNINFNGLELQFIIKEYKTREQIVYGFDIPCCKILFDLGRDELMCTPEFLTSFKTLRITDDVFTVQKRVDKYKGMGYVFDCKINIQYDRSEDVIISGDKIASYKGVSYTLDEFNQVKISHTEAFLAGFPVYISRCAFCGKFGKVDNMLKYGNMLITCQEHFTNVLNTNEILKSYVPKYNTIAPYYNPNIYRHIYLGSPYTRRSNIIYSTIEVDLVVHKLTTYENYTEMVDRKMTYIKEMMNTLLHEIPRDGKIIIQMSGSKQKTDFVKKYIATYFTNDKGAKIIILMHTRKTQDSTYIIKYHMKYTNMSGLYSTLRKIEDYRFRETYNQIDFNKQQELSLIT